MAQVTIRINGYAYTVGCEDGQEPHLTRMAAEIEQRITSIKAIGGQSGEARLLMLAALLLADELHDMRQTAAAQAEAPVPAKPDGERRARLRRVAARAEEIAADMLDA
ncbi:MAG: cell division protein ZapA [Acidocella sp.]|nr:cell division protein ZapA [Acidocella sp.]